ncbi:MAG TPA: CGNR zinc finger domain-containing protein [Candidatus Limnocylindria bacterium]
MDQAELDLLREFANTHDVERDQDELGSPELLSAWLLERGLIAPGDPVGIEGHARFLAIRDGIRALALGNNEERVDEAAVEAMNRAAASVPLAVHVQSGAGDGTWQLVPAAPGIDGFAGRMLGALAAAMADGSWSRVKACRNEACRWVFHDHSRNHSGTWCTMAVCGSRMKARAYRARRRAAASA